MRKALSEKQPRVFLVHELSLKVCSDGVDKWWLNLSWPNTSKSSIYFIHVVAQLLYYKSCSPAS